MKKYKKIVVFGGFSGKNAGDEAQIDATYQELKRRFPNHFIKIMSHVMRHTYFNHYNCLVGENSRIALFDTDKKPYYKGMTSSLVYKIQFLITGYICAFNARLVKHDMPTFLINARKSSFLYELKTSDLVFLSGGGYLTGATLPRLWDHLFVIHIANILGVPVVCSGQTIGMWNSKFTKSFASKELSKVKVITTRDCGQSIKDLKEIGISGENVFETFDDALFCEYEQNVDIFLDRVNLSNKKFVVMNILKYGAGLNTYNTCILNIKAIINSVISDNHMDLLLLPFAEDDVELMNQIYDEINNEHLHFIKFDKYDFRIIKGIIGRSEMCITMRHHPIIFSVGQSVPVIALYFTEYFSHKNNGAMRNFGIEKYCIDLSDPQCLSVFEPLFQEIKDNNTIIRNFISEKVKNLKVKKERFWEIVTKIINE